MYHKHRKKPEKEHPEKYKKKSPNKPDIIHPPQRSRFRLQKILGNRKTARLYEEMNIMATLARAARALAFTRGEDLVFAKGQYQPGTKEGKKLIAHELTHVLQQQGGSVNRQIIQRQEDGDNPGREIASQIIEILSNPPLHDLNLGCQRAWEILIPLDDDLFVQVINEIKERNFFGILTSNIIAPLDEQNRIMALIGSPGDQAIYDFMKVLKAEACRRLDQNRRDLDQMEEQYRETLRTKDTAHGQYIRNSENKGTIFALYNAILLDSQLQRAQTTLSGRLDYINLEIHTYERNLGADALLAEDTIYERAAQSYRDWLSQRAIIKALLTKNTQTRMILRDLFPAINVLNEVDRNEINGVEPPGIERVAEMIFEGFACARRFQDETREKILNGDMPVYKLDILTDAVKDIIKAEGRWEEPYSTYIENWLVQQERTEWILNIAGTVLEIGLTIAAFFTGGATAVLLGLAGGAVGLGMAAYNFEIAEDVMDAAGAGRGGSYQFADIEEASVNMFFATIDLFLSAIDFVLSATNALELVENVHIRKRDLGIEVVNDVPSGGLNSFKDITENPKSLYRKTPEEIQSILGEGWTQAKYGKSGTGWKFIKDDMSVFYHEGGRHVGPYYGFSSGATGKVKITGPGYIPLPGDKATIINIFN